MKNRYNLLLIIILLLISMLLVSCAESYKSGSMGAHNNHQIVLKVNTNTGKLDIDTRPIGNCKASHRKKGCIVVPRRETASITFKLKASTGWHLTEFKICAGIDKPDDCSLEQWQESEFGVYFKTGGQKYSPGSDGIIKLNSHAGNAIKKFILFDYNSTKQDYFYAIKACKVVGDPDSCIDTDPPIENGGRF